MLPVVNSSPRPSGGSVKPRRHTSWMGLASSSAVMSTQQSTDSSDWLLRSYWMLSCGLEMPHAATPVTAVLRHDSCRGRAGRAAGAGRGRRGGAGEAPFRRLRQRQPRQVASRTTVCTRGCGCAAHLQQVLHACKLVGRRGHGGHLTTGHGGGVARWPFAPDAGGAPVLRDPGAAGRVSMANSMGSVIGGRRRLWRTGASRAAAGFTCFLRVSARCARWPRTAKRIAVPNDTTQAPRNKSARCRRSGASRAARPRAPRAPSSTSSYSCGTGERRRGAAGCGPYQGAAAARGRAPRRRRTQAAGTLNGHGIAASPRRHRRAGAPVAAVDDARALLASPGRRRRARLARALLHLPRHLASRRSCTTQPPRPAGSPHGTWRTGSPAGWTCR
jgi:hypothetical protein